MTITVYPPLEQLLPHQPPMILIDRLVAITGQEGTCEVTVTPHSMFLEASGVPAFVGIEYMAQSVAAYGGYQAYLAHEPIAVGLLVGTRRLALSCQFFELGQTLRIHVAHVWGKHELMRFRCAITSAAAGTLLQQAELNVFRPKALQTYLEEVGHDNSRTYQRR
jgi:predicted hotdog family 3-hydroxylacyl-ACP dehydratase